MVLADTGSRALMPISFRFFGFGSASLSDFDDGVCLALDGLARTTHPAGPRGSARARATVAPPGSAAHSAPARRSTSEPSVYACACNASAERPASGPACTRTWPKSSAETMLHESAGSVRSRGWLGHETASSTMAGIGACSRRARPSIWRGPNRYYSSGQNLCRDTIGFVLVRIVRVALRRLQVRDRPGPDGHAGEIGSQGRLLATVLVRHATLHASARRLRGRSRDVR